MQKIIPPKIIALTLGVLAISFLVAFYAVAWQDPTQAPPEGNVAAPVNVGSVGQAKTGNLVVNAFGISGIGVNLFSMPSGAGAGKVLTSDASGFGTWQTAAVPSGMIAMFDTACPSGWTRFTALDSRFPRGASSYGGIGGSESHNHTALIPCTNTFLQASVAELEAYCSGLARSIPESSGYYVVVPPNISTVDVLPPYLNVVWCKKN